MASLFIRKFLKAFGVLKLAWAIKKELVYGEGAFMPYTPHLLIAVNRSLRWCLERGLSENSDYLEFGISRGFTLWYAQALANDMEIKGMRFFGFDSFFGLPPPGGIDKKGEFQEGAYYCPREEVEAHLSRYGVDWAKTFLIEGWFKDILKPERRAKYGLRRCSVCVVDCDLYSSTRLVLEFIEPLIQDKSIIIFDDWDSFGGDPDEGEQKAFSEFLQRNTNIEAEPFIEFGGHGKGFILNFRRK